MFMKPRLSAWRIPLFVPSPSMALRMPVESRIVIANSRGEGQPFSTASLPLRPAVPFRCTPDRRRYQFNVPTFVQQVGMVLYPRVARKDTFRYQLKRHRLGDTPMGPEIHLTVIVVHPAANASGHSVVRDLVHRLAVVVVDVGGRA